MVVKKKTEKSAAIFLGDRVLHVRTYVPKEISVVSFFPENVMFVKSEITGSCVDNM